MLINDIVKVLTDAGIEQNEANVEVKMLIEHFAGYGLIDIITGKKLDEKKLDLVMQKAKYRADTKLPIQYIIGYADFMGEKFIVNNSVLIPRDETEILVRKSVDLINENNLKYALDLCTGSGCIACMIAKLTKSSILGVDISIEALEVALKNMENLKLFNKAFFRKSDLFSNVREDEKFDIIISNPPYIPLKQKKDIQQEVKFEPEIALFTSDDLGIEFYKKIISKSKNYLNENGYILFELGINQSEIVSNILIDCGFNSIEITKDLAGIDRVICARYSL